MTTELCENVLLSFVVIPPNTGRYYRIKGESVGKDMQ